jgi:CubicO group peptidase (beta-lactamase class C family)
MRWRTATDTASAGGAASVKRRQWSPTRHKILPEPTTMLTAKPESMGMCSQRLARVDRFLAQRYVDAAKLPHALLQVARGGRLVHQSVLGRASLETGAPLAEDSIVRIYSMTKPITSVAFMMLVEEGRPKRRCA